MASTYSPSLRIELIGAGEQAGTWNNTTNTNLGTLIESAIAGYVAVSVTSANQAFTALDGAADQARNAVIALSTTTTANFAVYAPPQEKTYIIYNTTAYTATIYNSTVQGNTTAAGAGIAIPAGKKILVFSTGTDFFTIESTNITGVLAVANGGTGVTTSTGTGSTVLSASPTFTGTPTLPTGAIATTQTFGNSSTAIATTAFVQAALAALHPVGSIYINATNSTNPGTLLGFGTWVAFGAGRVPVGFDSSNALFDTAEETGGSADAITVSHTHTVTDPGHAHTLNALSDAPPNTFNLNGAGIRGSSISTTNSAFTGISINSAGSSGTNANYQPYITVYMWKRTV